MGHCENTVISRGMRVCAAVVLASGAVVRVEAQQNVLPPFIKDLAAVGVPINQGNLPITGGPAQQGSGTPNGSDPNHIFDKTPSGTNGTTAGASVLVLRNGRVLQGTIRNDSRGYFVDSRRSTAYFPFEHVKFVAADIHDAYAKLCDSMAGSSARRDLVLGRWCVENGLDPEAADHFRNVLNLEPSNREARQALARLEQSQPEEPTRGKERRTASASADAPRSESLSRLSGSAVREFVLGIQPILLARCGSVKCHGMNDSSSPSATSFRLEHVRLSQGSNRAATARNLDAVLALLDGQFPSQSALFQKGLQPHGGPTLHSPFDGPSGRAQEMRLRRWVDAIGPERNRLKREQATREFVSRFSRSQKPPTLRDPNLLPAGAAMGTGESGVIQPERLTPPADAANGFQNPGNSPRRLGPLTDPFDPSQFNAQNPR